MSASLLAVGAYAALGWAGIVSAVGLEATRRALYRERRPAPMRAPCPRVLLVRPCAGSEPRLLQNLCSLLLARRSFDLRCAIAVADAADPALPTAVRAAGILHENGVDARVVLTAARGPNRKVSQIQGVLEQEQEQERRSWDALLVADSDLDLEGAELDRLIAPLSGPAPADAAWAPPAEHGPVETAGDRASSALLGGSLHAFPLLAGLDRGGLVGKLFAVRVAVLAELGGFGALAEHLGEDMELARRIRARGGSIAVAPFVARSMASGRSWDEAVARFSRWLTVIRAQRPWLLPSYPLLFFPTPLIVGLAAISAPASPSVALAAALLALLSRIGVALAAARASGRPTGLARAAYDSLLSDLLLAQAFFRALLAREVVWRSAVLTVDRGGVLREAARE